ncbi:outer membrane protein OmpA-like peptidoglycan-associated protein [Paraburkholderia sp. HC6.4b]|uniref:OmpA family protein n=1 Tax=unclassified Paraburkholderia TaxID=2615204 RepID=UPI00160AF367|nr:MULTISPECIES: OmpA family protein [unclassified Paraburkholderia]MBB5408757.1 outer membrane protein OmpA-like peptidoglycan-associated protein [Paraburkholderia sp. HC6.4b]MBB5450587.1 outer membrane protein OmpA-like peptidoglycan-associated protein [Paraburkholderia sp. Kb1A]
MKSIDLANSIDAVFSDSIRQCLAEQIGLSSEILGRIPTHASPALIASLMAAAVTPDGAKAVFSAVMSPEANARIEEQFLRLCSASSSIKDLETIGESLFVRSTGTRIALASDPISRQAGIPPQAAHVMTALVGSVMFGVLKHHILLEQGTLAGLPALLGGQLPVVSRLLTDRVAESIGFENAGNFTRSIAGRLESVAANMMQPMADDENVLRRSAPAAAHEVAAPVAGARSSRRGIWLLFAVLTAILLGVFAYAQFFGQRAGVEPTASSNVLTSGVVAPSIASAVPGVVARPDAASSVPQGCAAAPMTASGGAASAPAADAVSEAASNPAANASTRSGKIAFSVNQAGVPSLTGTLSSDAERQTLTDVLNRRFGAGRFAADLKVDASLRPSDWLTHIDELLSLMALPRAEVGIDSQHIELGGAAANASLGWKQRLQNVFGPSWEIGQFSAGKAVDLATQLFLSAMAKLLDAGNACIGPDVATVLNLQVVDFAASSGHIPLSAKENLAESAQLLKACSDDGHPVALDIKAYSDNVGDEQANLLLSQKRADAVRGFLIEAGVKPDLLTARGYGSATPIASNATAGGRFANRRVEFVLAQASVG